MKTKNLSQIIKKTFQEWSDDNASRLAAALAYYTSFSLAPLLVLIISIAGLIGTGGAVQAAIMAQVKGLMGDSGAQLINSMIQAASNRSTGLITAGIGLVTLLLGALGVFGELQGDLDTIWEVKPRPVKGFENNVRSYLGKRVISFAMLLAIVFLLIVSLVVSAVLSSLGKYLGYALSIPDVALQAINLLISIALITLLFAMIFKYLPDVQVKWRDVLMGAFVTAILFSLGKLLIGIYLGKSHVTTTFGGAGSLALLLIWVYYSSQILFLGAEFTQVYAKATGSEIVPEAHAMWISEEQKMPLVVQAGLAGNGGGNKIKNVPQNVIGEPRQVVRCKQN